MVKLAFFIKLFSEFLNISVSTPLDLFLLIFIFIFLFIFLTVAYWKHFKLLLLLLVGIILFSWQGILAYPVSRYFNAVYPFLIFIFIYGIYLFSEKKINKYFKYSVQVVCFIILFLSIGQGAYKNLNGTKASAINTLLYREKFDRFFEEHQFAKNVNFILFGIPLLSDVNYIFQVYLNNFDLKVAHIIKSTLAEYGNYGCNLNYKIKNVKSKVVPVKIDGEVGFRLISLDEQHCGWWMNFSFFPLKWSAKERAYILTNKEIAVGKWYDYSMGKFKIHKQTPTKEITDVTFLIDDKWIDQNTVFVTWDTWLGKFKIVDLI